MANYDRAEHTIELVLRFRTNLDILELDMLMEWGPHIQQAEMARRGFQEIEYIPEGSHWRCIDIDPPASSLPGGNRLTVDDDPHYELDFVPTALIPIGRVYHVEKGQRTLIGSTGSFFNRDSMRTQAKMIAKRHRHGNAAHTERIELD